MLPRAYRLHKNRDIKRVLQKGVKSNLNPLRMHVLLGNRVEHPRVALIMGTKAAKQATDRNKTKRQLRALLWSELKASTKSADIVVQIHNATPYETLRAATIELLTKSSLL